MGDPNPSNPFEERKVKLKDLLEKHVKEDLKLRPDLELVAIADGTKDNWTYIDTTFPDAFKVLDFYHTAEHLKKAIDILFTDGKQALDLFEKYRSILRHSKKGINIVIDFLESQYDSNRATKFYCAKSTILNQTHFAVTMPNTPITIDQ
jgi:hypothetical protein